VHPDPGGTAARVVARGELDLATAPRLRAELTSLLDQGRHDLDVDLVAVTFCDVAGLTVLLDAHARAGGAGGRLVVHGSCPPLRLMLRVLRPEGAFEMAPGVQRPEDEQA
jgi:anti-anti-sigma factor